MRYKRTLSISTYSMEQSDRWDEALDKLTALYDILPSEQRPTKAQLLDEIFRQVLPHFEAALTLTITELSERIGQPKKTLQTVKTTGKFTAQYDPDGLGWIPTDETRLYWQTQRPIA